MQQANTISAETAEAFFGRYVNRKPNTKARYATYLRGFFAYAGIPFNLKVKVPRQLPPFIAAQDIETLRERLGDKRTHKATSFRDLVLLETACKEVPSKSV